MPRTTPTDEGEEKLLADVGKYGWHCMHVLAEAELVEFSYTIGLFHSYGYPELLIYGLPKQVAHAMLTIAADAAASRTPIDIGAPTDALLEGFPCVFVPVPLHEYREHFGFALWYYEGVEFPVQQVIWPSKAGRFPWHAEATASFRLAQPVLAQRDGGA